MIKLINEGFKKRYEQSLQESKMKDKTTNESLAESIKRVLSRLTEGPMSDEDKRETEILRNLYKRIGGKQLGKLSPEEKEVLNKYGIDAWGFRGDTKMITPGKKDVVKDTDLTIKDWRGRTVNTNNGDKINLADRARKIDNRTWGDKYVRPDWYQPRYGRQQAQQAERDDLADQMQKPLRDFKNARDEYKRAKKDVDNYYSDLGKSLEYVDKEYNDVVNDYDDLNWYKNNYKKSARKVQSILDKHRKKIESLIEQLNEATSPEDKADSNLLRNILAKREKRANAALTPQELAVLDKYGVNLSGKNIFKPNTGISMGSDSN